MSDIWYYAAANDDREVGPLTLQELKAALAAFSNAKNVLVWCDRFTDWKLAQDVPELKARTVVMFADRWLKTLPRRWARNGAIFGAIYSFAQLGTSSDIEQLLQNGYRAVRFALVSVILVVTWAIVSWLSGLWARKTLSRALDKGWRSVATCIPLKWTIGAALLSLLVILADAVFEWRGAQLQSGGSVNAVAQNVGYVVGMLGACSLVGFVVGLVSRWGLSRASSDDDEVANR